MSAVRSLHSPAAARAVAAALLLIAFVQSPSGQDTTVRLDVPPVRQPYNLCLAAAVSMVLGYWGVEVTPEAVGEQVPVYKDGTTGRDVVRYVEGLGLRGFLIQPPFEDLLLHLERRRPVIVVLPAGKSSRHAVVLTGFDQAARSLWLNDPASGGARVVRFEQFRREWEAARRWTLLIVPK
jgi:ABC-type bacteriocin/lantibiotic exporter with double-glycine peptidase domain